MSSLENECMSFLGEYEEPGPAGLGAPPPYARHGLVARGLVLARHPHRGDEAPDLAEQRVARHLGLGHGAGARHHDAVRRTREYTKTTSPAPPT